MDEMDADTSESFFGAGRRRWNGHKADAPTSPPPRPFSSFAPPPTPEDARDPVAATLARRQGWRAEAMLAVVLVTGAWAATIIVALTYVLDANPIEAVAGAVVAAPILARASTRCMDGLGAAAEAAGRNGRAAMATATAAIAGGAAWFQNSSTITTAAAVCSAAAAVIVTARFMRSWRLVRTGRC